MARLFDSRAGRICFQPIHRSRLKIGADRGECVQRTRYIRSFSFPGSACAALPTSLASHIVVVCVRSSWLPNSAITLLWA